MMGLSALRRARHSYHIRSLCPVQRVGGLSVNIRSLDAPDPLRSGRPLWDGHTGLFRLHATPATPWISHVVPSGDAGRRTLPRPPPTRLARCVVGAGRAVGLDRRLADGRRRPGARRYERRCDLPTARSCRRAATGSAAPGRRGAGAVRVVHRRPRRRRGRPGRRVVARHDQIGSLCVARGSTRAG